MADLLRDPIWQFVGAVVAVVTIFVAIWLSQRERNLKRLMYFMRSTELLSVQEELRDSVKIMYKDKPVEDVRLCEFGIKNTGNVPILPTDFISPVNFFFSEESRILTADISSTSPPDLGATILRSNEDPLNEAASSLVIAPLLLNQGDVVSIKALVTGSKQFDVRGRIVGIKEIIPEPQLQQSSKIYLFIGGIFGGIFASVASEWVIERSNLFSLFLVAMGILFPLSFALLKLPHLYSSLMRKAREQSVG